MRGRGWVAPVALAGLIVVILGAAGWLATRDDGGASAHRPAVLHLSGGSVAVDAAAAMATGAPDDGPGGSPYQLDGELPAEKPDDQTLWRLRAATADDVATVASALDLSGQATRVDDGWVLRDSGNLLSVRDDGSWSYGVDCAPDAPVSSEDISVGCAVVSGGGDVSSPSDGGGGSDPCNPDTDDCVRDLPLTKRTPMPLPLPTPAPGPSESDARAVAEPILARLGLDRAATTYWPGDPAATVEARPELDGLATVGWTTTLQVDGDGAVVSAFGWMPDPRAGDRYPVLSAQGAFDLLQDQPRPMMELCALRKDGKPGCADPEPVVITGAELGLRLDYDGQNAVLAPAWLFDVRDDPQPLAQVAVEPSLLGKPVIPTGAPATDLPASTEPGGTEPVAPAPDTGDQPTKSEPSS